MEKTKTKILLLFISSLMFLSLIPMVSAEELFSDDFETNNFSEWDNTEGTGSKTIVTTQPYLGTYHALFNSNGAGIEATAYVGITPSPIIYLRTYIQIVNLPANNEKMYINSIGTDTPASGTGLALYVFNNAGSYYWGLVYNAQETSENTASNPTTGQYYCVELLYDNTNNLQKLYINEVEKVSTTYDITNDASNVAIGLDYANNIQIYIDSVVISTTLTGETPQPTATPTPNPTETPIPTEPANIPIPELPENIFVALVIAFFFVVFATVFLFGKPCYELILISLLIMAFSIVIGAMIVIPISPIIGIFMAVYCVIVFVINVLRLQV